MNKPKPTDGLKPGGVSPAGSEPKASKDLRILIVDDHSIIRQGLRQILHGAFPKTVFGEADTANEALKLVSEKTWDVVLLDITMPGRSGMDVLKEIVEAQPNIAVLVLSMHPEDQYAVRVLKSGAAPGGPQAARR